MDIFVTGDAYNVIVFDHRIEIRYEPFVINGETIVPGDKIRGFVGEKSSAGFGSFELVSGFVEYVGRFDYWDEEGTLHPYVLFDYPMWPRNLFGWVSLHPVTYVCWILMSDGKHLFYEIRGNGRLIPVKEVIRYGGQR